MTQTPTDAAPSSRKSKRSPTKGKKVPSRGIRKRVLGNGEGDYVVMMVAPPDSDIPKGSLVPLADSPQFESSTEAKAWLKTDEKASALAGMQVAIVKFLEIGRLKARNRPEIVFETKPKIVVKDPTNEAMDPGLDADDE